MDTSELTGSLLDDLGRWHQRLYAIEELRQWPRCRADVTFVFEVGERAWRAAS